MRHTPIPLVRQLPDGMHPTEVLATIGFDDHGGIQGGDLIALPDEELATIALELDFDEVRRQTKDVEKFEMFEKFEKFERCERCEKLR
jgi:hypothetical protein